MRKTKQSSQIPFGYVVYLGIILSVIVGATNFLAYRDVKKHLLNSMDSVVHSKMTTLVEMSGYYIHFFELELLEELKNHIEQEKNIKYVLILNARNKPFFDGKRIYDSSIKEYQKDIMFKSTTLGSIVLGVDTEPYMKSITSAAVNSVGATILVVVLLGSILYIFFRSHVSGMVEDAKRKAEQLAENILTIAADGIIGIDKTGKQIFVNRAAAELLGYEEEELLGHRGHSLWHHSRLGGKKYPQDECPICISLHTGEVCHSDTDYFWRKDGSSFPVEYTSMPISEYGEITGTVVSFHDITERKAAEQKLRDISITDELTGVLNRRGFFEMAERQLKVTDRMKGELFLLFADIDDLKVINDTLGHQAGDQLLIDAGNILRDTFRQTDIIGRLGGDEFAVLLPDKPGANSEESVLIRLEENADNFNNQKSRSYKVMISSGVIKYDVNSPCTIDELLIKADKLMFVRKKERKGETEIR